MDGVVKFNAAVILSRPFDSLRSLRTGSDDEGSRKCTQRLRQQRRT